MVIVPAVLNVKFNPIAPTPVLLHIPVPFITILEVPLIEAELPVRLAQFMLNNPLIVIAVVANEENAPPTFKFELRVYVCDVPPNVTLFQVIPLMFNVVDTDTVNVLPVTTIVPVV